jgi:hypothetical protein
MVALGVLVTGGIQLATQEARIGQATVPVWDEALILIQVSMGRST